MGSKELGPIKTVFTFADGVDWFLLFEKDQFKGLIRFDDSILNDQTLIRSFPPSGGLLVQRNTIGEIRFFQGDALIVNDNRRWNSRSSVKQAAWKIGKCIPGIDKKVLSRILEFSFYVLSPASRVGGIFVWYLQPTKHNASKLKDYQLSLMQESHTNMIKHHLSQTDGATYLDPGGTLIESGIHLKVSENSRQHVKPYKGTRHTSGARFSYDTEEALVFVISEDGPVTVFFHGTNIAAIEINSVYQKTRELKEKMADATPESIKINQTQVACSQCRKISLIEEITIEGQNIQRSTSCTTCGAELHQSDCVSLESRPYHSME